MLKLVVRLHGQNIQVLELSDPATIYWAGRNENCQVPLKAENGISRQHFKVFFKEGLWNLEVVSRFNEIKVGDQNVRELPLQEGVGFSLAPYEFSIESTHSQVVSEDIQQAVGSGIVPVGRSSGYNEEIGERTLTHAIQKSVQYIFTYRNPDTKDEKIHILTSESYSVGRESSCDIILDDARVSRRQFQLSLKAGKLFLIDNQSVNGTYINKTKVTSKEPMPLNSGDQIAVLNHRFYFEIKDPEFESKMAKVQQLALVDPVLPNEMGALVEVNGSPNLPMEFNNPGMEVALPNNMFGGLQPVPAAGLPGDLLYQTPSAEGMISSQPSGALSDPEVKVLNFWGFKIPLTKKNKSRLAFGALVLVALVIGLSEDTNNFDPDSDVAVKPADPYSKLSPEDQKLVKLEYTAAKDLYSKGSYQLAKERLEIVHNKVPYYLDSKKLAELIEIGNKAMVERELEERRKREEAEVEEKIQNTVAYCRQQIKPTSSSAEIEECLASAIQLNPEHEAIVKVRADVARIEDERKAREAQEALRAAQIEELRKLYKEAYDLGEKDPLKGIAAFKEFGTRSMPDPDNLQQKAKEDIKRLERKIKARVVAAINGVKDLVESGKHKEAIIALEKATEVAPQDSTLRDEIERITEELRKKMQVFYQEGILEENIGNVDTAKDRWLKILDQDIPNGEYFGKAKAKMKKYGAG